MILSLFWKRSPLGQTAPETDKERLLSWKYYPMIIFFVRPT